MASDLFTTRELQTFLGHFGYYGGKVDGDYGPKTERAVGAFQGDYPPLKVDGDYGEKTDGVLRPLVEQAKAAGVWADPAASDAKPDIDDVGQLRRFRLTRYWIGDAASGNTPIIDAGRSVLATVSDASYVSAALEGTIFGPSGELINVAGTWVPVVGAAAEQYRGVYNRAAAAGWLPDRAGWAGIRVNGRVITHVMAFKVVPVGAQGYPIWGGIDADAFRTMATDPRIIPSGAWAFIPQLVDIDLPDGSKHDGWVRANDVGAAIKGAHIDLFVGPERFETWPIPNMGNQRTGYRIQLWSPGLEHRIPIDYTYGLA